MHIQGVPRIWQGGGGQKFFFQIWKFACREIKMVRFGVYFDQILSLKNFKNYYFLSKNLKNCNFLYKRIKILDTRNIILVKKFFEKFMIDAFWYLF